MDIGYFEIRGVFVRVIATADPDNCRVSAAGLNRRGAGKLAGCRTPACAQNRLTSRLSHRAKAQAFVRLRPPQKFRQPEMRSREFQALVSPKRRSLRDPLLSFRRDASAGRAFSRTLNTNHGAGRMPSVIKGYGARILENKAEISHLILHKRYRT